MFNHGNDGAAVPYRNAGNAYPPEWRDWRGVEWDPTGCVTDFSENGELGRMRNERQADYYPPFNGENKEWDF